jgi:hypothetical protein
MTCGYVCPQCEGKGVLDNGDACDYCTNPILISDIEKKEISVKENGEKSKT